MAPESKDTTEAQTDENKPTETPQEKGGDADGSPEKPQRGLTEEMKAFIEKEVNMDMDKHKPELLKLERSKLESSFSMDTWQAAVGENAIKVSDLNGEQWEAVFRNNSLLCAHRVKLEEIGHKYVPTAIQRTFKPAFDLKTNGTPSKITIPQYRADDNSSVSVVETKTVLETSLANSSFSETDVEAAAGGGAFGISAAAKASLKISESQQTAESSSKEESKMIVSYNFPRASVNLSPDSLEISADCKARLEKIKKDQNPDLIYEFEQEFGQYYATRVLLGGRLHSSSSTSTKQTQNASQRSNAMKAAASLAISSAFASGSASASHEKQSASSSERGESSLDYAIAWEAQGGDTLLCNNPPAWCVSVADYHNWRVVQQCEVVHLVDFIGQMEGYGEYPELFRSILRGAIGRSPYKFQLMNVDAKKHGQLAMEKFPPQEKDGGLLESILQAYGNPRFKEDPELFNTMRKQGLNHLLRGARLTTTNNADLKRLSPTFTAKHIDGTDIEVPHFNVMYIILDEKELQELYVTRSASFYEYQYAKSRLRSNPPKPSYAVFRQKNRQGKILKEDQFEIEFYDDKRQSLGKLAHANIDDNGTYQVMKEAEVEDGKPAALEGEYLKFRLLDP